MLPSPDISLLSIDALFDLSVPNPVITVINNSTGDHLNNCSFIFKVTSPNGLVFYSGTFTSPDIVGNWDSFVIPNTIPLIKGAVEWGGDGYQITVTVQDSVDAQYSTVLTQAICRPNGNTLQTTNNYGKMQLLVEVLCADAKIYIEDRTSYLYSGNNGTTNSTSLQVIYPQNTPEPFVYGSSWTNIRVRIFGDGDPYQVVATLIRDYVFDNGATIRIKYSFKDSFAVLCSVDLCCVQLGALNMAKAIATGNCSDDLVASMMQVNTRLIAIQTGKLQPNCNIDIYKLLGEVKDLLGDYYDCGCCNYGIPDLNGGPATNPTPVVYAGPDQQVNLPTNVITLNGAASEAGGEIISTTWNLVTKPVGANVTIGAPQQLNTGVSFDNSIPGVYVFMLTAVDGRGVSASDTVGITLLGAINVSAGGDQTLTLPNNSTNLAGSASVSGGTISLIQWTQDSGPNVANISTPSQLATAISGLIQGTYIFKLFVKDNAGRSASSTMQVIVNLPAISVNAGPDQNLVLPVTSANVNAVGVGYQLSYLWTKISGPTGDAIINGTSANAQITGLQVGDYVYKVKVTDAYNQTAEDTLQIHVTAPGISANAGNDQTIFLPQTSTSLNGSGSTGNGLTYLWTVLSGPGGSTFSNANVVAPNINNLVAGNYTIRLTVTDNASQTAHADMHITVAGTPVVNAGNPQTITLPTNSVNLSGTATVSNGSIVSVLWTKQSGPSGGTIGSPTTLATAVTGLQQGTYVFLLQATDNYGHTGQNTVTITVNPQPTAQFTAYWGWSGFPFVLTDPSVTQNSNTVAGSLRTQVWTLAGDVVPGMAWDFGVYSHNITVTAVNGDTIASIITKIVNAINATTETQWNSAGTAPAHGTAGFPPTASGTSTQITVVLDSPHQFAVSVRSTTNVNTFTWNGSGVFNVGAPIVADYRASGNNVFLALKFPNTEANRVSYNNDTFNNGPIPDQNFNDNRNDGTNKFVLSRQALSFSATNTTTFN